MGFFKADPPPPMPILGRADFAEAVSRLPDGAGWYAPELEYLDQNVGAKDSVVALATFRMGVSSSGSGTSGGALALTETRMISALGGRDKRGKVVGARPSISTFEIEDMDRISAEPCIKTCMETSILMKNGDLFRNLLIGPTLEHGAWFVDLIEEALTKAKLA